MMIDSKRKSLIESILNIIIGTSFAFVANIVVLPLFGMPYKLINFGYISLIYTGLSLVRSYFIRRWFANGVYESIFGEKDGQKKRKRTNRK